MTAMQDDTVAELQRAIAELRRVRDAGLAREATLAEALATRTAELATRNSEYGEQIEHQLATVDVLGAMSEFAWRPTASVCADHPTCFEMLQLTRGPVGV